MDSSVVDEPIPITASDLDIGIFIIKGKSGEVLHTSSSLELVEQLLKTTYKLKWAEVWLSLLDVITDPQRIKFR